MERQNKIFFGEVKSCWMRRFFFFLSLNVFVIRSVEKMYMFLFAFFLFRKQWKSMIP